MNQSIENRPKAVTVIGWFCIAVGLWGMICDGWNISRWILEPATAVSSKSMAWLDALNSKLFVWVMFIDAICSLVECIAGAYLLKLRAWARITIEVVAWIDILFFVVAPMFEYIYIVCFTGVFGDRSAAAIMPVMLFAAVSCGWMGTVNGLIIYFLRSKKVRDAFASPPPVAQ
ncbi:MAG: hypothetical protein HZA88_07165 [Verrucomicrobia bacterium]|nr:hypothetical protein [Verrucomicrobiota bacterium]